MKLKNYNIVYLNLDSRLDRKKQMNKQLKQYKLKATRISAVNGKMLKNKNYRNKISKELQIPEKNLRVSFWMNRSNFKTMINQEDLVLGRVGCFLSHLKIMKYALTKNFENIIVLEDDVTFLPNINSETNICPPNKSDICYLGGMFWHLNNQPKNTNKPWIKINPKILKIICTFSYLVSTKAVIKDIYNLCMSCFIDGKGHDKHDLWRTGTIKMRATAIDFTYINYFQKNGNCYIINPVMFYHNEKLGSNISPQYGKSAKKKWKHLYFFHPKQKYLLNNQVGNGLTTISITNLYNYIYNPKLNKFFKINTKKGIETLKIFQFLIRR